MKKKQNGTNTLSSLNIYKTNLDYTQNQIKGTKSNHIGEIERIEITRGKCTDKRSYNPLN